MTNRNFQNIFSKIEIFENFSLNSRFFKIFNEILNFDLNRDFLQILTKSRFFTFFLLKSRFFDLKKLKSRFLDDLDENGHFSKILTKIELVENLSKICMKFLEDFDCNRNFSKSLI